MTSLALLFHSFYAITYSYDGEILTSKEVCTTVLDDPSSSAVFSSQHPCNAFYVSCITSKTPPDSDRSLRDNAAELFLCEESIYSTCVAYFGDGCQGQVR